MRVLVLGGNARSALAVARSVYRRGHEVWVGDSSRRCLAGASRSVARSLQYPSPMEDSESYVGWTRGVIEREQIDLLLPVTDECLHPLSEERSLLPEKVLFPFPDHETLETANDKEKVLALAKKLGVPVPKTASLAGESPTPEEAVDRMNPPFVLKPTRSRIWKNGKAQATAVEYAASPDEALDRWQSARVSKENLLLQERVEGDGTGYFALFWDGKVIAEFCHRRLREKPPSGGVSVLSEGIPISEEIRDFALSLLRALNWQGVAMVEFKRDRASGVPKLMEINPRFWGSLQLAIDSGVDFPALLVDAAQGKFPDRPPEYEPGRKLRWLLGDLDHLWIRWTHSDDRCPLPAGSPGRLGAMASFAKFWGTGMKYDVLRLNDPGPFWHELKTYFGGRH